MKVHDLTKASVAGKIHDLKCDKVPFWAVYDGTKKAEFRINDRDYQVGDHLVLCEYQDGKKLNNELLVRITHMQTGYGIPDGYVMLSFAVCW
ncbi:DUF3850 domain-containing protein [Oxalicibacterium faecigallinarum]|uniref:DUF3850 domain-containing protein n=1 Tax=Oxalicibacterium faecigallinarum TaxID=573741 RepID=A0A8J3ALM7_9BURK|nr:DUF3850 domain-containing protein [Oxalicibacterium faecigallinarum]GGI16917.1 hypothetical protein GCM10008066_06360 [Oxalicibacterium faecigallinarum]